MASALAAGRRLFHGSSHLWLRATKESSSSRYPWLVEIGFSPRGLADIGDVTALAPVKSDGFAQAGDKLATIDWDAHTITSADELYHTVWETFSEQTLIRAPISGVVDGVKELNPLLEELDEETVVVRMKTDDGSIQQDASGLMEEQEYDDMVARLPQGKFLA